MWYCCGLVMLILFLLILLSVQLAAGRLDSLARQVCDDYYDQGNNSNCRLQSSGSLSLFINKVVCNEDDIVVLMGFSGEKEEREREMRRERDREREK